MKRKKPQGQRWDWSRALLCVAISVAVSLLVDSRRKKGKNRKNRY